MFYDLDKLKIDNLSVDMEHGLFMADLHIANDWIQKNWDIKKESYKMSKICGGFSQQTPKKGDLVEYTHKYQNIITKEIKETQYKNAIITELECYDRDTNEYSSDLIEICERPYIPFIISIDTNGVNMSVSGGSFKALKKDCFKFKGYIERTFCNWGSCGARGNGAISFNMLVAKWEYIDNSDVKESKEVV